MFGGGQDFFPLPFDISGRPNLYRIGGGSTRARNEGSWWRGWHARDAPVQCSNGVHCGPSGLSNVDSGPKSDKSLCTRLPDICPRVDPFIHHFLPFVYYYYYISIHIFLSSMSAHVQGVRRRFTVFKRPELLYGLCVYGIIVNSRETHSIINTCIPP